MLIQQFFKETPLEFKDIGTLIVGISALAVSITSLTISKRQKQKDDDQKFQEKKLNLRKQLTEILEKLSNLNIEWGKYDINRGNYPENFRGILSDQRRFFVRQADYIAKQIDDSVSPVECRLIAQGFDNIDDDEQTIFYFDKAIDKATNYTEKIISRREYARYLFKNDTAGSSEHFRKIFEDFPINKPYDYRLVYYRATTYERWANLYKDTDSVKYRSYILASIEEWENHNNALRKAAEQYRLRNLLNIQK